MAAITRDDLTWENMPLLRNREIVAEHCEIKSFRRTQKSGTNAVAA